MLKNLTVEPTLARALLACTLLGSGACATANLPVETTRTAFTVPDYWEIQATGEGKPAVVIAKKYGDADVSAGGIDDRRLGEPEYHVFDWALDKPVANATEEAITRLMLDPDLKLSALKRYRDDLRPDCGFLPRKYTVLGNAEQPAKFEERSSWHAIVVGGQGPGALVAVVGRVKYDQDYRCVNLSTMQTKLDELLATLSLKGGGPSAATPAAPAAAPPAGETPPAAAPPAEGAPPADPAAPSQPPQS